MHIPIEKKKDTILKLFELIKKKWEVYLPLEGNNKFVILKTVCSKCGMEWYVDEKECYYCKFWYPHLIKCNKCGGIIAEENMQKCPLCNEKPGKRICLNCDKGEDGQFVPITFCNKCGNRKNRFEWRIINF